MCGIVAAASERNVVAILLEGLKRLEYRGYDSAGLAVSSADLEIQRIRAKGKVSALAGRLEETPLCGSHGIAHTRWATHGAPVEHNGHPHISRDRLAIVHNGIIENYLAFKPELEAAGYIFQSETDTEVVAHLLDQAMTCTGDLVAAVQQIVPRLQGAYSFVVMDRRAPDQLVAVRKGTPLIIGEGLGEYFLASDSFALLPVTHRFMYLEEGDIVQISRSQLQIWDASGALVERAVQESTVTEDDAERGPFRHFMQKEIFAQPQAILDTLEGRLENLAQLFPPEQMQLLRSIQQVHIVACGTSYHAGLIARHWLEEQGIACIVEVASEYRYRAVVTPPHTLFVGLSQSGETLDTLEALKSAKARGVAGTLAICNVADSALVRESDFALLTRAGREIGVASTKAFTTQLTVLRLLCLTLADTVSPDQLEEMRRLPAWVEQVLQLDTAIEALATDFVDKHHALFLGRGVEYPVAMEGALKLKEISYIHAEAYPAGELKHGPLALVDADMPVVAVLPQDGLLEKLLANLQEVQARGGKLYLFADRDVMIPTDAQVSVLHLPAVPPSLAPLIYTVPLQLLAYHVAVIRGTDVDQPRNLAKSVTVE